MYDNDVLIHVLDNEQITKTEHLAMVVNSDLRQEFYHMHYYLHASAIVQSPLRIELGEWLMEEAKSELKHCKEFSDLVVHLGGQPFFNTSLSLIDPPFGPNFKPDLRAILTEAKRMEANVAHSYSKRLRQTENHSSPDVSYVHVFYEEQLADSWKTSREIDQMLRGMES